MPKHLASYRIYVIRCWAEPGSQTNTSACRFSLEIPATGQRFGFTNFEELINALKLALSQIQTQEIPDAAPVDEPD